MAVIRRVLPFVLLILTACSIGWAGRSFNSGVANADDTLSNWTLCIIGSCSGGTPGGTNAPAATNQTINNAAPSKDGESMLLSITSPVGGLSNALWTYKNGANDALTNFQSDFWVNPSANSASAGQFEYDNFLFSTALGTEFMFGHQCDQVGGKWQVFDQLNGVWVNTTTNCSGASGIPASTWTHIILNDHRIAGDTSSCSGHPCEYYDNVIINGTTFTFNLTEPSGTIPGGWTSNSGFQFQINVPGGSTTITENLDLANFNFNESASAPGTGVPDDLAGEQMSFTCWFMLTAAPAQEVDPCSKWKDNGNGGYNFSFNQTFSGSFANKLAGNIYITASLNHLHQVGCAATINLNQWYNATLVYQNAVNMKVWIGTNGTSTLCGTDSSVGAIATMQSSGTNLVTGGPRVLAGYAAIPMAGYVAEEAAWNVRLSDGEVKSLATVCPNLIRPTALVGYWPMTGASARNAEPDLSGNSSNGSTQSGVLSGTAVANHPPCRKS